MICFFSLSKYIEETGVVHFIFRNCYENGSDDVTVKSHEISNEQFLNQLLLQGRLKPNTLPRRYSRMLVPDQIFEKWKQFVPCSLSQVRFEN